MQCGAAATQFPPLVAGAPGLGGAPVAGAAAGANRPGNASAGRRRVHAAQAAQVGLTPNAMSRLATAAETPQMRVRSVSLGRRDPGGVDPRLSSAARQENEATASLFARPRRRVAALAVAAVAIEEEATPGPPSSLSRSPSFSGKPRPPRVHPDVTAAYSFESVLGAGAFGTVWACRQHSTGALAALKIVDRTSQADGDFQLEPAEAEILKKVSHHPNIVKLLDYFASDSCVYLAMELVDGGNVQDRLDEVGHFSEQEGASIFKQVVSAVHHLHDQGITHRDIKPDNLLFAYKGNSSVVKLTDFGLSTMKEGRLTAKCGTPSYCAPELLSGAGYGRAVDLWALGVLAYVLIVGELPFRGKDRATLFKRIQAGHYSYPPTCDRLGHLAKDIISRLLRMTPMDRYSTRETLQHPWVAAADGDGEVYRQEGGGGRRSGDLDTVHEMMRRFNAQERWRRAALAVLAVATFRAAGARRGRRLRAGQGGRAEGADRGGAGSGRELERWEDRATNSEDRSHSDEESEDTDGEGQAREEASLSGVRKRLTHAGVSFAPSELSEGSARSHRGRHATSERSEGSARDVPSDLSEESAEKRYSVPARRPSPVEAAASATSVPFIRPPPISSSARHVSPQFASGQPSPFGVRPGRVLVPAPPASPSPYPMPSPQFARADVLYAQSLQQSSTASSSGSRASVREIHEQVPSPEDGQLGDRLASDGVGPERPGAVWAAFWPEGAVRTPAMFASQVVQPPSGAEQRPAPLCLSSASGDASPPRGHAALAAPLRRVSLSVVLRSTPPMLERSNSVLSRVASGTRLSAMGGPSSVGYSGLGSGVTSLSASGPASPVEPRAEQELARTPPTRRKSYPNMESLSFSGPRTAKPSASGLLGPGSAALVRAQTTMAGGGPPGRRSLDYSYHCEAAHAAHTVQVAAAAADAAAHARTPAQLADAAIARAAGALDHAAGVRRAPPQPPPANSSERGPRRSIGPLPSKHPTRH